MQFPHGTVTCELGLPEHCSVLDVRALVVAHKLDKGFLPSLGHPALLLRTIVVDKTDVEDFSSIVITAVR